MENDVFKISINTEIIDDSCISQEIIYQMNELITNQYRTVIDTQDKEIKKALMKLGWTPPKRYHDELLIRNSKLNG